MRHDTMMYRASRSLHLVVGGVLFATLFTFAVPMASAAATATLKLSPTSSSVGNNQTFSVNILLDTVGNATDGVDVFSIHFNPAVLQVVDDNPNVAGVQITPGTLMPATTANSADNTAGTIQFSQAAAGGSNYSGSGILATINFRAIAVGTSAVTIDFTAGNTADSNVAYQGTDLLASVTNASFTVTAGDTVAPTVSISVPSANATVSGSAVTVTATASDNVGVAGVQFKLDGTNIGAEDTASPYSITWNTSGVSNGTHTLTAVARDAAGNTTTSSGVSVTVANTFTRNVQLNLEGRTNKTISGTVSVLDASKTLLKSYTYSTNSSGLATITFDIAPQIVYLKFNPVPFLTKLLNVDLNSSTTYTAALSIGDLNQDNIINSVDYSILNSHWFTADATSDLNQDGLVNSVDFSYMNQHWLQSGDI